MSATNRKTRQTSFIPEVNERHEEDFYRTTPEAADAILRPDLGSMKALRKPKIWIDAGAGDGAIAARVVHRWPESRGICIELDPMRAAACGVLLESKRVQVITGDFLKHDLPRVDLVIGNPPFKDALPFARRALQLGKEVALLLRVGFEEGAVEGERDAFLEEHPHDLGILTWRPDFNGKGTDSATYAWFVFGPGRGGRWARLPRQPRLTSAEVQIPLFGQVASS